MTKLVNEHENFELTATNIIPDDKETIKAELVRHSETGISLILTSGGTGFAPRDVTPEATLEIVEKQASSIMQYV